MLFGDDRLADQITHVIPGRDEPLPRLEKGDFDATLVALRRFDAYRALHPTTKLIPSGYYLPIGFNMGFVGLSTDRDLIEKVTRSIALMLDSGELGALARAAGVTYRLPRQPNVSPDLKLSDCGGTDATPSPMRLSIRPVRNPRRVLLSRAFRFGALALALPASAADPPHNIVLFVPDGLRALMVSATTAPTMADPGQGCQFQESPFPVPDLHDAERIGDGDRPLPG
jgi:hypothetical protein